MENKTPLLIRRMADWAVWLYGLSFGIGTVLLLLEAVDGDGSYLIPGYLYVIAAAFINTIAFIILVANAITRREYRKLLLLRAALLLANIPVTLLYMYLVFEVIH